MIVVAGLVVLVGAMAAANYRGQLPRYCQERCAFELAAGLRAARAQAQSFNAPVQVTLDAVAARYTTWSDRNTNGAVDAGEQTVVDLEAGRHVSLVANAAGGAFDTRGRFGCSNGCWTVVLRASGLADRTVRVLPGGQVDWTGR
jgi:Tfp pilus assembly protein FimT